MNSPLVAPLHLVLCFLYMHGFVSAQQNYPPSSDIASDCYRNWSVNSGYLCSQAAALSCPTFAYYRSQSGQSLSLIASLFQTNASSIAIASGISSSTAPLTAQQPLFVPLHCSCSDGLSAMAVQYTIQSQNDTFYSIAYSVYEGLTTCQAILRANPTQLPTSLSAGDQSSIPLRCACPSQSQIDHGVSLLLTYPVTDQDVADYIVGAFGVDLSTLYEANNLSQNSLLFGGTTLLIPLRQKPQKPPVVQGDVPPLQAPPNQTPPAPRKSFNVGICVRILTSVFGVLFLGMAVAVCFLLRKKASKLPVSETNLLAIIDDKPSKEDLDEMIAHIDNKLIVYSVEEINSATRNFSAACLIEGSVYHGALHGQRVAIKRTKTGVSQELSIFQKVHHSRLLSPLGYCTCTGQTDQSLVVYPLMENGSLRDWLRDLPQKESQFQSTGRGSLGWTSRVRIVADVADAVEYLHDLTMPSFVHKNIKSINVLIDSRFRGKLANFGLFKSTESLEQGMELTRRTDTEGYMAPEYLDDGCVSPKLDVFAFGVVLLEVLSGEAPIIRDEEGGQLNGKDAFLWACISSVLKGEEQEQQRKLVGWMDPGLEGHYPSYCALKLALLAKKCVEEDAVLRPSMSHVATDLLRILEASEKWERSGENGNLQGR